MSSYFKPFYYCLFFALVFFTSSCKEKEEDLSPVSSSFEAAVEKAIILFDKGYKQESISYIDSSFRIIKDPKILDRFEYYNFLKERYVRLNKDTIAEVYIDSLIRLFASPEIRQKLHAQYASAHFYKGDILMQRADYANASVFYHKAKAIVEENKDTCELAYYSYVISMMFFKTYQYEKALNSFKESYNNWTYCNSHFSYQYRRQELLDNIGLCYDRLGKWDSALLYYNKALDYIDRECANFASARNNKEYVKKYSCLTAQAVVYGNMGKTYLEKKDFERSVRYLKQSIGINKQVGFDNLDAQRTRLTLAKAYYQQGMADSMANTLAIIKQLNDQEPNKEIWMRWNYRMSQYHELIRQKNIAYDYLAVYTKHKDSVIRSEKAEAFSDIGREVEVLEKGSEIESLKKRIGLRQIFFGIALVGFIFSSIIAWLVLRYWRKSRKHVAVLKAMNDRVNLHKMQLQKANEIMAEKDLEKDRILKIVSHDLRSPMNSILAIAEFMEEDDDNLTSAQKEYVKLIKQSSENSLALTQEILVIVSFDPTTLDTTETSINNLIADTVKVLHFNALEKGIKLELQLPKKGVSAGVNKDKLNRAVHNLINNAIKFSKRDSTVSIKLYKEQHNAVIAIQDNGIGIPLHLQSKIFDLFTDARRKGTEGEEPFGLGLSITKQIIEAHGGKIEVISEEDNGTTFYIYLPLKNDKS